MLYELEVLKHNLVKFSYDEMCKLCLSMGIGLDELYLRGKGEYNQLLVVRMKRAYRLDELVAKAKTRRPDLDWGKVTIPYPIKDSVVNPKKISVTSGISG